MNKKTLGIVLAAAMLVTALGGCGSSSSSDDASSETEEASDEGDIEEASSSTSTDDGEKTVIHFYEHSDNETVAQQQVDEYNASQSDVEVELTIIANDDYDDKITVLLSGGADVDVFWIRSGSQMRQLANTGAVLALDDFIEENNIDFSVYGQMGEAFQTGGHTYGMCTTKSCWLLWYNKDLFDAAGLDYPLDLTWDDYADLCAELTTEDTTGGVLVNWILNIGSIAEGEYLTDENLTRTREYVEFLNRIYNEDESNPSIEEMSGSFDVNSDFATGDTYMMINGDWTFLLMDDYEPGFEWCAAPLPHFDDLEVNTTIGSTSAYGIYSGSENAEAAFDFIQFCTYSEEGSVIYAENQGIPCYSTDEALEIYQENITAPGSEYVFAANVNSEDGNEDYYSELKDAYATEIEEYLVGTGTIDDAFNDFIARREEIISDYE